MRIFFASVMYCGRTDVETHILLHLHRHAPRNYTRPTTEVCNFLEDVCPQPTHYSIDLPTHKMYPSGPLIGMRIKLQIDDTCAKVRGPIWKPLQHSKL